MIESLEITGFRRFKRLRIDGLRRINLFVGKNNCGKTSVLEAVAILGSLGNPQSFRAFMEQRGELIEPEQFGHRTKPDLDLRRLFCSHVADVGSNLVIKATNGGGIRIVRLTITDELTPAALGEAARDADSIHRSDALSTQTSISRPADRGNGSRFLQIEGQTSNHIDSISIARLSPDGGLPYREFGRSTDTGVSWEFVPLESPSSQRMAEGWSSVALTTEQDLVEESLRLLDSDLQKIAYVQDPLAPWGTFRVKLRSFDSPVPLGSLGGGIWRMLAMIIALVKSKGGFLLVDELDTGLHHSVLSDVWRILIETAAKLDVQVFATTHSLDCIKGLAALCRAEGNEMDDQIAMHRIDPGRDESIHYSERQIVIAAERGIETR